MLIEECALGVRDVSFSIPGFFRALVARGRFCVTTLTSHAATRPKMVVAYTVLWCEVADAENQRDIEQMQEAGIIVRKITYPHRLPPA